MHLHQTTYAPGQGAHRARDRRHNRGVQWFCSSPIHRHHVGPGAAGQHKARLCVGGLARMKALAQPCGRVPQNERYGKRTLRHTRRS